MTDWLFSLAKNNGMKRVMILSLLISMAIFRLSAQTASKISRSEYIELYKDLAVKEMYRSGIPASITLAQGMLESDNGNSRLAIRANNHFGIKCHSDWQGRKIYHDDDSKGECFRKYDNVYESYADHSDFLMKGSRYAFLFELDRTDYEAWAKGLKKAGYATSNQYAELLIRIIEENNLHQYDLAREEDLAVRKSERRKGKTGGREIFMNNRVDYVLVKEGDSYAGLNEELQLLQNEIFRYNELTADSVLYPGQIIYLQPKRNRASRGNEIHILREGESYHDVAQQYAIKLDILLQKNQIEPGSSPVPGTRLQLRKGKVVKSRIFRENIPVEEDEIEFEFDGQVC